jgi:hypothetical protein
MKRWADEIRKVERGKERSTKKEVSLAMIAANNHYAGFGPGTSNLFRKMVGLSELSWVDQQQIQKQLQQEEQDQQISDSNVPSKNHTKKRQSSLTDFIE